MEDTKLSDFPNTYMVCLPPKDLIEWSVVQVPQFYAYTRVFLSFFTVFTVMLSGCLSYLIFHRFTLVSVLLDINKNKLISATYVARVTVILGS